MKVEWLGEGASRPIAAIPARILRLVQPAQHRSDDKAGFFHAAVQYTSVRMQ
jgi:hypothetical protein